MAPTIKHPRPQFVMNLHTIPTRRDHNILRHRDLPLAAAPLYVRAPSPAFSGPSPLHEAHPPPALAFFHPITPSMYTSMYTMTMHTLSRTLRHPPLHLYRPFSTLYLGALQLKVQAIRSVLGGRSQCLQASV